MRDSGIVSPDLWASDAARAWPHDDAAAHDRRGPPQVSKARRIVHVDDDTVDQLMLRRLLSKFGDSRFEIIHIDSFSEALACLQSESFDVGLIDYQLGGATGLELVEQLGGRLGATPLVILTGRGDRGIDVEATKAGAFDYLDKNDLSADLLERTIRNVRVQFETEQQLRQSERLLRQAKVEAEAANAAKSEFLARMSHDLRTPLNAILGFSEVVRDQLMGPVGTEKYLSYAGDIHQSGLSLLSMINAVLDLSKVESGTLELYEEDIDLEALSSSTLRLFEPGAQVAGVSLRAELTPGLPVLRADRLLVDRMLSNLVSNAIKFTPPGGQVLVSAQASDQGLRLIVEDTGIGIAPHLVERVLEPFGQVGRSQQPSSGFGLGLAIVRSLIELHGGSLAIEAASGSGTRAILAFPSERAVVHRLRR